MTSFALLLIRLFNPLPHLSDPRMSDWYSQLKIAAVDPMGSRSERVKQQESLVHASAAKGHLNTEEEITQIIGSLFTSHG